MNRFITDDVARRRLFLLGLLIAAGAAQAKEKAMVVPGCAQQSPQQCVTAALEAMGGRERLQQVSSVRMQTVGHTLLMEQSYRQAPFITSYERGHVTLDLVNQRLFAETTLTWPESTPINPTPTPRWWSVRMAGSITPNLAIRPVRLAIWTRPDRRWLWVRRVFC